MRKYVFLIALALATTICAKPSPESAASPLLKPTEQEAKAALLTARFLTRFHYKAEPLDDAMSEKIFARYLDSLDADRLFFLSSDVEGFSSIRDKFDDAIYNSDLSTPFAIFNLYQQRVSERTAYARNLLKSDFDFSKDESYTYERDKTPWVKTAAELDDLWRKRVKNDWLRLKLAKEKDLTKEKASPVGKNDDSVKTKSNSPRDIQAEIRQTLDKRYANYYDRVRQLKSEDVFQTFMNAYAMSIEPHTNYLGPRASENFDILMKLSLEGIGAVLQPEDEYTTIREIMPGSPAALSGKLKAGDRIVGVGQGENGPITDVLGWRLDDVVELIRGPKDSVVRLDVLPVEAGPDGKHQLLAITRKKINLEESAAKSSLIEVTDGPVTRHVGVISLPGFYMDFEARRRGDKNYKSATRDVAKLLTELKKQNVDGILVDLRNNGGGSLSEATDLTGLFIDKGPVVQVRNAQSKIEEESDTDAGMTWDGPLAVLVNRNSASASEIFAAAIQDYGRGLIIGEPTFGKGTVQTLIDLDQAAQNEKPTFGEIKMTMAQFFRINGGTTQQRGVTPDIAFPVTVDFEQNGEQTLANSLPWSSIAPAHFQPVADLKGVIPMLEERHDMRVGKAAEWRSLQEDIAEFRKLRKETTISLNEDARRKERDAQETRRLAREQANRKPDGKAHSGVNEKSDNAVSGNEEKTEGVRSAARADDGLQAGERSLKTELAHEKELKKAKDVLLEEAAHILSDEIGLIKADTKLAERVLPHTALTKEEVN